MRPLAWKDHLDRESDQPDPDAEGVEQAERRPRHRRDGSKRRAERQEHPQPLKGPSDEKARGAGLDLVEARIRANTADAPE